METGWTNVLGRQARNSSRSLISCILISMFGGSFSIENLLVDLLKFPVSRNWVDQQTTGVRKEFLCSLHLLCWFQLSKFGGSIGIN